MEGFLCLSLFPFHLYLTLLLALIQSAPCTSIYTMTVTVIVWPGPMDPSIYFQFLKDKTSFVTGDLEIALKKKPKENNAKQTANLKRCL